MAYAPTPTPTPTLEEPPYTPRKRGGDLTPEFLGFWKKYPHKVGKPKAAASFAVATRKTTPVAIMAGLERYIATKPPDRAWCNPTTFLNQERWTDVPADAGVNGNGHAKMNGNGFRFGKPPHDAEMPETPWKQRIALWRKTGNWPLTWGPKPGDSGCQAPKEFLT